MSSANVSRCFIDVTFNAAKRSLNLVDVVRQISCRLLTSLSLTSHGNVGRRCTLECLPANAEDGFWQRPWERFGWKRSRAPSWHKVFLKLWANSGRFLVYFRPFLIPTTIQFHFHQYGKLKKAVMVCIGFEPELQDDRRRRNHEAMVAQSLSLFPLFNEFLLCSILFRYFHKKYFPTDGDRTPGSSNYKCSWDGCLAIEPSLS